MLTVKQVAALLACSEPNVYDLARSGKLPCVRVGSNGAGIRFRESDVDRFLADGGVKRTREKVAVSSRSFSAVRHYDVASLKAAWLRQGVRVDSPDGYNAPSSLPLSDPSTVKESSSLSR